MTGWIVWSPAGCQNSAFRWLMRYEQNIVFVGACYKHVRVHEKKRVYLYTPRSCGAQPSARASAECPQLVIRGGSPFPGALLLSSTIELWPYQVNTPFCNSTTMKAYAQVIHEYCQGTVRHRLDWNTGRVDGDTEANQRWWCDLLIDGNSPKKQDAKEAAAKQAALALGL